MGNKKLYKQINWILLVITIIANVIAFKYLPDKMVVQIDTFSGEPTNYLSRNIFIFIVPIVLLLSTVYSSFIEKVASLKYLVINIVLVCVNVFMIYFNIK